MKVKSGVIAGGFAALALAVVSAAGADSQGTINVKARLTAGQVVPRGTVKLHESVRPFQRNPDKDEEGIPPDLAVDLQQAEWARDERLHPQGNAGQAWGRPLPSVLAVLVGRAR